MIRIEAVTSPGPIRPAAASSPASTAISPSPTLWIAVWARLSRASEVLALTEARA